MAEAFKTLKTQTLMLFAVLGYGLMYFGNFGVNKLINGPLRSAYEGLRDTLSHILYQATRSSAISESAPRYLVYVPKFIIIGILTYVILDALLRRRARQEGVRFINAPGAWAGIMAFIYAIGFPLRSFLDYLIEARGYGVVRAINIFRAIEAVEYLLMAMLFLFFLVRVQKSAPAPGEVRIRTFSDGRIIGPILSLLSPGLGQMYKGYPIAGAAFNILTIMGYVFLFIPGLILHLGSVLHALLAPKGDYRPNGAAGAMSVVIPGLGQILQGRIGVGLLLFVGAIIGYILFVLPGVIVHIFAIWNAVSYPETLPKKATQS